MSFFFFPLLFSTTHSSLSLIILSSLHNPFILQTSSFLSLSFSSLSLCFHTSFFFFPTMILCLLVFHAITKCTLKTVDSLTMIMVKMM
ncbi:hypothetical protein Pint_08073 [Pistacia integerrima]|uniref:Uncharacterized protein n=1 Tax=Pistacia integerrima TaxID=434235 RepID=A0ACC0XZI4_9ROSI|nr:hypothetical protein Pint_08073 [Pistacia integerrima]